MERYANHNFERVRGGEGADTFMERYANHNLERVRGGEGADTFMERYANHNLRERVRGGEKRAGGHVRPIL